VESFIAVVEPVTVWTANKGHFLLFTKNLILILIKEEYQFMLRI